MVKRFTVLWAAALLCLSCGEHKVMSGNPLFEGWYADSDGAVFE